MSSTCLTSFHDNGPRFLLSNVFVGLYHLCCGILIGCLEHRWMGIWYALCSVATAALTFWTLRASYRQTRKCGDVMGLLACLDYGHFWSSFLLLAPDYADDVRLRSVLTPLAFLLGGLLMTWLTLWHKKVVCPRDINDPSHISNQQYPRNFRIFKFSLGPLASFVYGMAESRLRNGLVPAPSVTESLLGFITAGLMFALYYREYRQSRLGSIVTLSWSIITGLLFVLSCLYYGFRTHNRHDHMQFGISMMVLLTYSSFFLAALLFKICLLKEPLNLRASPVDPTKSQTRVVANGSAGQDIEPGYQTFGLSPAQKLDRMNSSGNLTRSNTQATAESHGTSPQARH